MVFALLPAAAWAADQPFLDDGASGDVGSPYRIATKEQLASLSEYVNAGSDCEGQYFELTQDIDLENEEWTPIGNEDIPFKGTFDGGDHIVSGLFVDFYSYQGLFGKIENGTVKNLGVAGSADGNYYVGGITALLDGGTMRIAIAM